MTKKKAANCGVVALSGYEFQRNCALYLLLDGYEHFREEDYFLCIEHYDDFLFCFRTNDTERIKRIISYQAKKKSGALWRIDGDFGEILAKMLEAGAELKSDLIPKCDSYSQETIFISNTELEFFYRPKAEEKDRGKEARNVLINEAHSYVKFDQLPGEIKEKACNYIQHFCDTHQLEDNMKGLSDVRFQWIDFQRTSKKQKEGLVGLMQSNFSHIADPKAAIDVLLELFREVETTFNQGNIVQLMDTSKRVEGEEIRKTMVILDTKQKTYDFWRDHSSSFVEQVNFPLKIRLKPEEHIGSTFELLKDMNNFSYQIIREYVKKNDYSSDHNSFHGMFNAYLSSIKLSHHTNLKDFDILLAILCSFVEFHC
ncbi:hypothetical protein [Vibrio anguillarum]|uniref:hypothetical protein n=3 Tax=Vibrio anguillarum TaxID=55601 RepID=UPI0018FE9D9B|nr:hypothetical protein [Vibrio anguillarum]MBF4425254.1 hypothetical protein [Vibrio anguillarum]